MSKSNFWKGLIFGILVGLIIWYWQKSTSAEDGALELLDKLADTETRFRRVMGPSTAVSVTPPAPTTIPSVDLEVVKGIGPAFAARLRQSGVETVEKLAKLTPQQLSQLLEIGEKRAETILGEAVRVVS